MLTKIIVIAGPTASGKSDVAVALAKKFNGEVISADSRQVYKGLDIGTGKITKKEMRGVRHHLLDVVSPKKCFTASDFVKVANETIVQIATKNKVPIVCGGTGFYIDALLGEKQIPEVPPNPKLRKQLEKKSVEKLFGILKKLDSERAKNIDAKNPRRLIRAIEICKALGKVPPLRPDFATPFAQGYGGSKKATTGKQDFAGQAKYEVYKIGIVPKKDNLLYSQSPLSCCKRGDLGVSYLDEKELKKRISKRIDKWFKKGLLKEVQNLHKKGLSWKRMSEIGLEYKLVAKYFTTPKMSKGDFDISQLKKMMAEKTWQYAKRQMTWFKKDKSIIWFNPKISLIEKEVRRFL